jgi:hypothetical protein
MERDILTRLQRLERDNRILKYVCITLVGLAFVMCAIAATSVPEIPEEIVARSFKVIGKNGQNSAIMAATDDGYVGIFFRDPKHKMRFMTLMTPAGDTTMSFADGALKNRLEIGAIAEGSAKDYSLRLLHSDGSEAWKPPVRNEVASAASR